MPKPIKHNKGGRTLKHDKPLGAFLIGTIIVIPLEIISIFFKNIGWTSVTNGEACSMMFIPEGSWILGLYALPLVGGLTILMLYKLTRFIGTDHLPIKGFIIGMFAKAFVFAIFGTLAKNDNLIQSTLGNYVIGFNSGFGGFLGGVLMKKYLIEESSSSRTMKDP